MEAGIPITSGLKIKRRVQTVTIAAAASTNSTIEMPAGALVLGVTALVKVVIPTATVFDIGDSGDADRFAASVAVAAGTKSKGTRLAPYVPSSAQVVKITPDQSPATATGKVKLTIHYIELTAPSV
jgi:hypothetical protein